MYLDDTLEPAEIRLIGQKVSESVAAQELIERIRQVTRRRRLTTPPLTGPDAKFDANTMAAYLDNELTAEQVADLEKVCLESDVHLAEVAACHQILALVQGEPALVPPSAKERMYGLVQGREAIPFRKATAAGPQPVAAGALDVDGEDTSLFGMPSGRSGRWPRWTVPVATILALVGVGVALWLAVLGMTGRTGQPQVDKKNIQVAALNNDQTTPVDAPASKPSTDTSPTPPASTPTKPGNDVTTPPAGGGNTTPPTDTNPSKGTVTPPNKERDRAGKYTSPSGTSVLVRKEAEGGAAWRSLETGDVVHTSDAIMSLPGCASELRLDSGVGLLLRGLLPDFLRDPLQVGLQETAVVLHKTNQFDADLTLDRGRLYISNGKDNGAASVRLRFGKDEAQVWDLTLHEPRTEIGIDLLRTYTRDPGFDEADGPRMQLYFQVLRGRAGVKLTKAYVTHSTLVPPPGSGFFHWDNYRGEVNGPQVVPNKEASERIWSKAPPTRNERPDAEEMVAAISVLSKRMLNKKPPLLNLHEMLEGASGADVTTPAGRRLVIYAMSALDDVRGMIDALADEHDGHLAEREAAIFALRRWLGRDVGQVKRLYDPKEQSGLLRGEGLKHTYTAMEARTIAELLAYSGEEQQSKETYELLATHLRSSKVAISELAYYHLRLLSYPVKLPLFNSAWPQEERRKVSDKVRDMIEKRELPPPPEGQADGGKPMGGNRPGP
jgi:hypothetical protein